MPLLSLKNLCLLFQNPDELNILYNLPLRARKREFGLFRLRQIPKKPFPGCHSSAHFAFPVSKSRTVDKIGSKKTSINLVWEPGLTNVSYHVYCDMKPYICTFSSCSASEQLFETFGDWRHHETTFHWREWQCKDCSDVFGDKDEFLSHVGRVHDLGFKLSNESDALSALCERPIRNRACPLCSESNNGSVDSILKHISRHLRQLAISSLPPVYDDGEENEDEDASVASRNANLAKTACSSGQDSRASLLKEKGMSWGEENDERATSAETYTWDDPQEEEWGFIAGMKTSETEAEVNASGGPRRFPTVSLLSRLAKGKQDQSFRLERDLQDSTDSGNINGDRSSIRERTNLANETGAGNVDIPSGSPVRAPVHGLVKHDLFVWTPDELESKAGSVIEILAQSNPEWVVAEPLIESRGPGLIPLSFVEILAGPVEDRRAASDEQEKEWLGRLPTAPQWRKGRKISTIEQQEGASNTAEADSDLYAPISARVSRYCFAEDKYWFIVEAEFEDGRYWELSRYYEDFYDFQIALLAKFPMEAGKTRSSNARILPFIPGPVNQVTDAITEGRLRNLNAYIELLLKLPLYISRCTFVMQFFAPREGDHEMDSHGRDHYERASLYSVTTGIDLELSKTIEQDAPPLPGVSPLSHRPQFEYPYTAKAISSYEANPDDTHGISFKKDDILDVCDVSGSWWKGRKENGDTGIIPSDHFIKL